MLQKKNNIFFINLRIELLQTKLCIFHFTKAQFLKRLKLGTA